MLKLNRITDYAVVVLTTMASPDDDAVETGNVFTTTQLASATGVQTPTVAKLMKQLAQGGLVDSQRGAGGGYFLTRSADDISVADIVTAMEGPIALAACVEGAEASCSVEKCCPMAGNWNKVNFAIQSALQGITLMDMATPSLINPPVDKLLAWQSSTPPQLEVKGS